jgi:RNA polymerase sigma-70 factor (ECF subfamily)
LRLQETPLQSEEDLLANLSQGDPAAFREIIEVYFPILCRFAEKYLPDSSLAKDVVQEVFIKFWNAGVCVDNIKNLKAYLFVSTKNGCLNLARGRDRQQHKLQDAFGNEPGSLDYIITEIVKAENISLIYQAVRTIPKKMQEVFRLSYEDAMTVKEISVHLNMTAKTVRNSKYKALALLRNKFANNSKSLLFVLLLLNE